VIGLIFIFGIYPLSIVWPSGWAWGQGHSHYPMMIIGIYATLGVFHLMASRDPAAHKRFGSLCGRAWYTEQSWLGRDSATQQNEGISLVMCSRFF
jgi:hypothetical protein